MIVKQISMDIQLPDGDTRSAEDILRRVEELINDELMVIGSSAEDISELYNE